MIYSVTLTKGEIMKKFILLIALSALFYSVPGNAMHRKRVPMQQEAALSPEALTLSPETLALSPETLAAAVASLATALAKAPRAPEAAALTRLEASFKKCEKQITTFWECLVLALRVWKTRTDQACTETDTAQKFIAAEVKLNPIAQLLDKCSDDECSDPTKKIFVVEDETADGANVLFALEDKIVDRADGITGHVKHIAATARSVEREAQARLVELSKKLTAAAAPEAVADDDDSQGLKAALWAAAPEAAAVVDDDDSEEFKARCFEIIEAGEDLPSLPLEMQQEMLDISRRILKKEEATINGMEQAYYQLLEENVKHKAKVIVLVDDRQAKVQQSFGEIQQSFKDLLVECYAQRGMPFTLSTQEAHPLVYLADDFRRCLELVVVTDNNANQMRAHYSYPRTQAQMNPHAWVEGQPAPEDEVLAAAPAEMREAFEGKEAEEATEATGQQLILAEWWGPPTIAKSDAMIAKDIQRKIKESGKLPTLGEATKQHQEAVKEAREAEDDNYFACEWMESATEDEEISQREALELIRRFEETGGRYVETVEKERFAKIILEITVKASSHGAGTLAEIVAERVAQAEVDTAQKQAALEAEQEKEVAQAQAQAEAAREEEAQRRRKAARYTALATQEPTTAARYTALATQETALAEKLKTKVAILEKYSAANEAAAPASSLRKRAPRAQEPDSPESR